MKTYVLRFVRPVAHHAFTHNAYVSLDSEEHKFQSESDAAAAVYVESYVPIFNMSYQGRRYMAEARSLSERSEREVRCYQPISKVA